MNGAHYHLLVNHIPVFAMAFGLIALLWATIRPSVDLRRAAIALFVVAGASAWLASETGDAAEDVVKNIAGVTKALIQEHEQAADFAQISAWIVAAGALALAACDYYKKAALKKVQIAVLILALWSASVMARTAYLGGMIRHTEIRAEP